MESGKILTDINYGFLIEPNKFAVASTVLKVQTYYNSANSIYLKLKGFNNIADRMYKNLQKDSLIMVTGKLLTDGFIEVESFKIL